MGRAWLLAAATVSVVAARSVAAPGHDLQLSERDRVRITLRQPAEIAVETIEGTVARSPSGLLAIETPTRSLTIDPGNVASLSVRDNWLGVGATIGIVLGGMAGLYAGGMIAVLQDIGNPEPVPGMVLGAMSGALVLGLVGALIGYAIPDWQVVYPAPRPQW